MRREFRSGHLDEDPLEVVLTRDGKTDAVVRTVAFSVLEFGLSDGGAECHVPQGRCLSLVRLTASKIAQECQVACALSVAVGGLVGLCPVDVGPSDATVPRTPSRPRRSGARTARRSCGD